MRIASPHGEVHVDRLVGCGERPRCVKRLPGLVPVHIASLGAVTHVVMDVTIH